MEQFLGDVLDAFLTTNDEIITNFRPNGNSSSTFNQALTSPYMFLDLVLDLESVNTGRNTDELHSSIISNTQNIRRLLQNRNTLRQPRFDYDFFVRNVIELFRDNEDDDFGNDLDDVRVTLTNDEFNDLTVICSDMSLDDQTCSICLEECKSSNDRIVELKCKHVFHDQCIRQWLTKQSTKCCVCRVDQRI